MKNLIKFVFVLLSLVFAQQASADCWSSPPTRSTSLLFFNAQTGYWCTSQQGQQGGSVQLVTQQPLILNRMPDGYGYRDCTAGESLQRDALTMLKGAVVGALIGDTGRAAGIGGGLGLLFSTTGSCRVAVPQGTVANQGVLPGQTTGVTTHGVACSTGGETMLVSSVEQCARLAMKIAAAATPAPTTGTVNVPSTPDGKIGCTVNTGTEKFRFNAVKGVKFGPDQCNRYVSKEDQLPPKEDMSLL